MHNHKVVPVTGSSGCVSTPCLVTQHEARDFSHEWFTDSSRFQGIAPAHNTVRVSSRPLFKEIPVTLLVKVFITLSLLASGLSFFGIIVFVALCESGVVSLTACILGILGLTVLEMVSLNFIRKHSRH